VSPQAAGDFLGTGYRSERANFPGYTNAAPPGGQYLGLGPAGYYLGYELFGGRQREEEAQRKQMEELQKLLKQMRPGTETVLEPILSQERTGRYHVGEPIPPGPTGLSDALTAQTDYPIPGPGYAPPAGPPEYTSIGPGYLEPPLEYPIPGPGYQAPGPRPPAPLPTERYAMTTPWSPLVTGEQPSTYPGGMEVWPPGQEPPPRIAYPERPPEVVTPEAPPEAARQIVTPPGAPEAFVPPVAPEPAPKFEISAVAQRREPIERRPVLTERGEEGRELEPVTRMRAVTRQVPGKEFLDLLMQDPKTMLGLLKAFPGLLQLIQQEQENQAWAAALPKPAQGVAAPPPVAGGTAAAAPTGAPTGAPTAPPAAAPTEETGDPVITAAKAALEPQIRAIANNPALLRGERGKAAMKNYLDLEKAQGEAEERLGKRRELELKTATAQEEADFRQWALNQAQARYQADDPQGAEDYIVMSRNPQLGAQIIKERRERLEAEAQKDFFTRLADKEQDPDRKLLLQSAAVSKGVAETAMKILTPEEKALTNDVLTAIGRTGIDPRTRQPAAPDLLKAGKDFIEGGIQAGERVARAGAEARAKVELDKPIAGESRNYADENGMPPSSSMPKGNVYDNFVNITNQQGQFLQAYHAYRYLLDPKKITEYKTLFPYTSKTLNNGYRRALAEGLNPLGLNATELKKARNLLAEFSIFDTQATQLARLTGETGNIATADTDRVTNWYRQAGDKDMFETAANELRRYMDRTRAYILAFKGKQAIPTGIAPPAPGEDPQPGSIRRLPDGTIIEVVP
jgi:hypothetical protein